MSLRTMFAIGLALVAPGLAMALEVGQPAPDFSAPSTEGKTVTLADFKGQWVVLYFYPKSFTTGCTKEACSLRDGFPDLKNLKATVLGVSFDDLDTQNKFRAKYNLPFNLLADTKKEVAKAYDVIGLAGMMAKRETFIIDPSGKIAHIFDTVNVEKHGSDVEAVLKQLQAGNAK